jgi:hypothetical protein
MIILSSCVGTEESKPFVVEYANRLIEQYPNFASNEIAKKAVTDSIYNHAMSFVGKQANDLNGIEFKFERLIEGQNGYCAVFTASRYTDIENPINNGDKYLGATINIAAFGNISDEVASRLDKNTSYSLSGILHAWDDKNTLNIYHSYAHDALDFGIYILDDILIKEFPEYE